MYLSGTSPAKLIHRSSVKGGLATVGSDHKRLLEEMYQRTEDPWEYAHSEYEQEKYASSLAALPGTRYGAALEIGCSEGVFTNLLAERVDRLLAVDVSDIALTRARFRCASHRHVEFRQFDLVADDLAEHFDLIVCSEVLYYVPPFKRLEVARRIVRMLKPGGTLLLVHTLRSHTRTWPDIYGEGGAERLHRVFTRAFALPVLARHFADGYEIVVATSSGPELARLRRTFETWGVRIRNVYPGLRREVVIRLRRHPLPFRMATRAHARLTRLRRVGETE
jgi:SAM-dependent methyltransferase